MEVESLCRIVTLPQGGSVFEGKDRPSLCTRVLALVAHYYNH